MRGDGLKPSLLALNSLINAFSEDRRDAEAFAVLEYMKENVGNRVLFPVSHSRFDRAFFFGCFLCFQGVKPDVVTYTTLMKALIRVDKFDKV